MNALNGTRPSERGGRQPDGMAPAKHNLFKVNVFSKQGNVGLPVNFVQHKRV